MKLKNSLLAVALITSALLTANTSAHEQKAPTQDMKEHDMTKMPSDDMKGHSAGSMELHEIMMSAMKMPMKMSGNVDKDFASMMSMHHQMAIKMVDVLLKHGSSAELKGLASKMKAAQKDEIKRMAPYTK